MLSLDRKLVRDLLRLRGQVLASALLVACGVAVFVMSHGTLYSLDETRIAFYERYRFAHVFAPVKRAPIRLSKQLAAIPGVKRVEARISAGVTLDVPGVAEPASGRLVSLPPHGRAGLNAVALMDGRMPRDDHVDEVLVSQAFAEDNAMQPGARFGAIINGSKRQLRVTGIALSPEFVYALAPGALVPDNRRYAIVWMPRKALEAAYDMEGAFNDMALTRLRGSSEAEIIAAVDRLLDPYGGTGAYGREDQASHAFLAGELDQLRTIGNIIPPIFLAVAAFLLNVIVSRLIDTEREQIGLLKAFGYSDLTVGWHYMKLTLAMVLIGVALGCGLGLWLGRWITELYADLYRFPFLYYRILPSVFVAAGGISLAMGGIGVFAAVRRAARLAPAVAMQPPAPPRYRGNPLERTSFWLRLDQPTRMILRHLTRWPLRSMLAVTGLAMSGALMIANLFYFDAIERMIESHFVRSFHQDISIGFVEPQHPRILTAVRHLPGVQVAEGERAVAVRLRHGPRSERAAIQSVAAEATLAQVLDRDLRRIEPPEFGLMLSTHLAKLLAAGVGDRIQVEVLEGRRRHTSVRVTAVVEAYLGTPAYMSGEAIRQLTGEGPRVSSVNLAIDDGNKTALYEALKATPKVASTSLWTVALESFRATIAESIDIVISFYVGFGSVIAFGVAYNSARITLSERARELATLRVLGFSRFDVSYILLGELMLLTLVSLPLGCLAGYGLAAFMVQNLETDLYRIPLYIERGTYALSAAAVLAASLLSGLTVRRRLDRLDLVSVLKTRE